MVTKDQSKPPDECQEAEIVPKSEKEETPNVPTAEATTETVVTTLELLSASQPEQVEKDDENISVKEGTSEVGEAKKRTRRE